MTKHDFIRSLYCRQAGANVELCDGPSGEVLLTVPDAKGIYGLIWEVFPRGAVSMYMFSRDGEAYDSIVANVE